MTTLPPSQGKPNAFAKLVTKTGFSLHCAVPFSVTKRQACVPRDKARLPCSSFPEGYRLGRSAGMQGE